MHNVVVCVLVVGIRLIWALEMHVKYQKLVYACHYDTKASGIERVRILFVLVSFSSFFHLKTLL